MVKIHRNESHFLDIKNFLFLSYFFGQYSAPLWVISQFLALKSNVWYYFKRSQKLSKKWKPLSWLSCIKNFFGVFLGAVQIIRQKTWSVEAKSSAAVFIFCFVVPLVYFASKHITKRQNKSKNTSFSCLSFGFLDCKVNLP